MTTHDAKWAFFSQVSTCGKVILEIEEKALDSSIRSLFNKRNHAEYVGILSEKIRELQIISTNMRQRGSGLSCEGLQRLIEELIGFASALSAVCEGLNEKSLNRPYSQAMYTADLKMVEVRRSTCALAQARAFD